MPAVPKKRSKGLRKDKKARAPGKQPICGLHAAAKCAGVHLKTAADVDDFRKKCFAHGLLDQRNCNWVGGTRHSERVRICEHFGCTVSLSHYNLVHGNGKTSAKSLLKNAQFFKTKDQYMLQVHKHAGGVRAQQRHEEKTPGQRPPWQANEARERTCVPDPELEPLFRQRACRGGCLMRTC
jgi:hypothetical protein